MARRRTAEREALGRAVRELRLARGLSQEQLGHESGLHRNYVGGVERGELNPTYESLLRLAAGVGVRASALVCLTERLLDERS